MVDCEGDVIKAAKEHPTAWPDFIKNRPRQLGPEGAETGAVLHGKRAIGKGPTTAGAPISGSEVARWVKTRSLNLAAAPDGFKRALDPSTFEALLQVVGLKFRVMGGCLHCSATPSTAPSADWRGDRRCRVLVLNRIMHSFP